MSDDITVQDKKNKDEALKPAFEMRSMIEESDPKDWSQEQIEKFDRMKDDFETKERATHYSQAKSYVDNLQSRSFFEIEDNPKIQKSNNTEKWNRFAKQLEQRDFTGQDAKDTFVADYEYGSSVWMDAPWQTELYDMVSKERLPERAIGRAYPVQTNAATSPTRLNDSGTASYETDLAHSPKFITPHRLSIRTKIAKHRLAGAVNAEAIVMQALTSQFNYIVESEVMTGSGALELSGIFTTGVIDSSRHVNVESTSGLTYAGLVNARQALKGYWARNASFFLGPNGVGHLLKLTDDENNPIWNINQFPNAPTMSVLGRPLNQFELIPDTYSSGNLVGMFADPTQYQVISSEGIQVQRYEFAITGSALDTNNLTFELNTYLGGCPRIDQAFVLLKASTS